MKILIAEDDINIRNGLNDILSNEGYNVITTTDGNEAVAQFKASSPDFIILDIMMPNLSGYEACKQIRKIDEDIPIIFLSAKSEEIDKVLGLELGADDFITKPFGVHEIIARIRAITRRCLKKHKQSDTEFAMADLTIYPNQLCAKRESNKIELSLREVKILQLLHDNKNHIVDRNMLLDHCWGEHIMPESRTVDQHIAKLRKNIELDHNNPKIITTVHGVGYKYMG